MARYSRQGQGKHLSRKDFQERSGNLGLEDIDARYVGAGSTLLPHLPN